MNEYLPDSQRSSFYKCTASISSKQIYELVDHIEQCSIQFVALMVIKENQTGEK